jgi:hypothetical protein
MRQITVSGLTNRAIEPLWEVGLSSHTDMLLALKDNQANRHFTAPDPGAVVANMIQAHVVISRSGNSV